MLKRRRERLVRHGRLTVATPLDTIAIGQNGAGRPGRRLDIAPRIRNARTVPTLTTDPDLHLGKAWNNGSFVTERRSLPELLRLALARAGNCRSLSL